MMRIGSGEMILIFALALFIFGPARLPELGRMVGGQLQILYGFFCR